MIACLTLRHMGAAFRLAIKTIVLKVRFRRVRDLCREVRERLLSAPLAIVRQQYGQ
jgi:hypothetical protein